MLAAAMYHNEKHVPDRARPDREQIHHVNCHNFHNTDDCHIFSNNVRAEVGT